MFYISISNGLLKDGHPKRMGSSVWEFMWCIDRITRIDADGRGWVLGGKPIKLEEIKKDLGLHRNTISDNLINLENLGYIQRVIAPYGIILFVKKAKKRFTQKDEPISQKPVNLRTEKREPNKTIQNDNISKTGEAPPSAQEFFENESLQEKVIVWLQDVKKVPREAAESELKKFTSYWTELNKSGTSQRWQGEKYFDIRRRLTTWFGNAARFAGGSYSTQKSKPTKIGVV